MSRTVERASNSDAGPRPSRLPAFHAVAWRWHFYAGLYVVPFLLMLALTGAADRFFSARLVLKHCFDTDTLTDELREAYREHCIDFIMAGILAPQ